MRAILQANNEVWINTATDANDLTSLATQRVMGMSDRYRFQRELGKRGSVLRGSRQCKIEGCKRCICKPWTPLPKHKPTRTRMGSGRNDAVPMQWRSVIRCLQTAPDHNGYWKGTSNPASTASVIPGC